MKPELFDTLVTLPPSYSQQALERVFPTISLMDHSSTKHNQNQTVQLKATQRDARRYTMLRKGLRQFPQDRSVNSELGDDTDDESIYASKSIVEPVSWARLAYTSFIWWASAGENRDGLSEEEEEQQIEQDARLLASIESLAYPGPNSTAHRPNHSEAQGQEPPEVAVVAYFRRLTTQIFFTLAGAIARHDNDGGAEDGLADSYADSPDLNDAEEEDANYSLANSRQSFHDDDGNTPLLRQRSTTNANRRTSDSAKGEQDMEEPITITVADMAEMGLDVWSATDRIFVVELVALWWGRPAYVDSARIRCCGISIL